MKRVVIIHQDSIRSYSVEKQDQQDKVGRGHHKQPLGFFDRLVPPLEETRRSRARFAQREETLRNNPVFALACERASLKPTPRQAKKWNRKHGLAYKTYREELQK